MQSAKKKSKSRAAAAMYNVVHRLGWRQREMAKGKKFNSARLCRLNKTARCRTRNGETHDT